MDKDPFLKTLKDPLIEAKTIDLLNVYSDILEPMSNLTLCL